MNGCKGIETFTSLLCSRFK